LVFSVTETRPRCFAFFDLFDFFLAEDFVTRPSSRFVVRTSAFRHEIIPPVAAEVGDLEPIRRIRQRGRSGKCEGDAELSADHAGLNHTVRLYRPRKEIIDGGLEISGGATGEMDIERADRGGNRCKNKGFSEVTQVTFTPPRLSYRLTVKTLQMSQRGYDNDQLS
jgi:hypothetical protein